MLREGNLGRPPYRGCVFRMTVTVREVPPASPAARERTIHSTLSLALAYAASEAENARSTSAARCGGSGLRGTVRNVMPAARCGVIKIRRGGAMKVISGCPLYRGCVFSDGYGVRECSPALPAACERTIHLTPSVISACASEAENEVDFAACFWGGSGVCGVPSGNA